MTDPLGQSQVLPYLSGLSKLGYSFHLISFEKQDKLKLHRKHIQQICDEAGIVWHPQDYTFGGLKRTILQVRKMLTVADYLFERHHFQLIHCRSYISALAGVRLKHKYKVPFLFDMRGFWADERVDGKLWNLSNPLYKRIYKYFKHKEKIFLKDADAIVSLTSEGKKEMTKWNYINIENKTTVIPCCVNLELFDSSLITDQEKTKIKNDLNIDVSTKVLGYVGSIGTWYMLDEMLEFYSIFRKHNEKSVFLFISGEDRLKLLEKARLYNIPDEEIIVRSVTHDQVASHISIFDLSVFFILPSYSKKASSPTKQGELMAMGIPIICNSGVGDTAEIIKKYDAGSVIDAFTKEDYNQALENLSLFNHETAINGAFSYFSLKEGIERYQSIYKKLID